MPVPRRFALAALCALPFAAAACGDSSTSGQGGAGDQVYRQYACSSCHSLDGSEGTGPTFKGLAGSTVTLKGGKTVQATPEYLERAIVEPDAEVVEGYAPGLMTASIDGFDLKDKPEDVRELVKFIQGVE
jgi:mono/diheme cytochrome c family protein